MKKIIFVINNLEIGGVQISLINLLNEIKEKYDVSILSFYHKKDYEKIIPQNVKLIRINTPFKYFGMSSSESKKNIFDFFYRTFWIILTKLFGRSFVAKIMSLFHKKIKGFDTAISYLHEGSQKLLYGGCNEFVLNNIECTNKITWLHCDFKQCGANNSKSLKIYEKFDKIIACSKGCLESFLDCMPQFKNKCSVIRNCNNYEKIKLLTNEPIIYDENYINIVTVARLSREKSIDRALVAIKYCLNNGHKIKYHIIGNGPEKEKLIEKVNNLNLCNYVVFYGSQTNPYKYIKNADLFLLTSIHEAAPMVLDEAAFLCVPALATKTTSIDEMIIETNSGFVCQNTQEDISMQLHNILSKKETLEEIKRNLKSINFTNTNSIYNFDKIV